MHFLESISKSIACIVVNTCGAKGFLRIMTPLSYKVFTVSIHYIGS